MNNLLNAAYDADNKAIRTTATGAGSAATIADGADVTEGAVADASVAAGATGTISAKLRRISADIDSIKSALATSATGVVKLEDSVHASGDAGIPMWSVSNEAQSTLAGDGDYIARSADTKGNTINVGNVASGSTDSGAPIKVAGRYNAALPTLTDGQRGDLQLNASGGLIIGGSTVASGATDSGNPVKTGGVNMTTQPTLTDGQRGNTQLDTRANTKVALVMGNTATLVGALATNADGNATTATASHLAVVNRNQVYNGTTWDRMPGDTNAVKTEQRFSYTRVAADAQVKGSAGFLHTINISATGIVTAGVITIYDSLTETGTVIWSGNIPTGISPTPLLFDVSFATGLYIGYDGTIANVQVTASYR